MKHPHPIGVARLFLAEGLDATAYLVQEATEDLARLARIPDRLAQLVGRPLERVRRGLERAADVLDPGEEYVSVVKPIHDAIHYWQDEEFHRAFDIIERTKEIREAGPR